MGNSTRMWQRANKVIPNGNMLYTKQADRFLPGSWPTYFSRAKGCHIWDLDGKQFCDVSIMGIGTNILGYANPEVDCVVHKAVEQGNMSTLNCVEEVLLAEKLIEINPWADMVRFARSGGEAVAVAVRIGRAASGKSKIAFCGYHGWHDWYLAANLDNSNGLQEHVMPGLGVAGVPPELRGSIHPFRYNDLENLEQVVSDNNIGVIIMEVQRNIKPRPDFLRGVRDLATKRNTVLIFDESTSGFRETFGGLSQLHGVDPDIAVFGKALGNGYAITSVVGRREVMEAAEKSFISSTFWTERIGPVAGLKTLEVMEKTGSWKKITDTGNYVQARWQKLADEYNLDIEILGIPALSSFTFKSKNQLAYKTLITQEMLKRGFLATTTLYVCTEHTREIIDDYLENLACVFQQVQKCEEGGNIQDYLENPICLTGFGRLN
jgi:glutamate-1-semialdehyde 2,1-aminomutase